MLDKLICKKRKMGDGVKQILYKNLVASMVTLNLFTFLIYIFWFYKTIGILIFIPLAVLNRRVIINHPTLTQLRKLIIYGSFFLMFGGSVCYGLYLINFVSR